MSLAERIELVRSNEQLLALLKFLALGAGELARQGFVRGLEVRPLRTLLCEVGVKARSIGGSSSFNSCDLVLYHFETVIIRSNTCSSASPLGQKIITAYSGMKGRFF